MGKRSSNKDLPHQTPPSKFLEPTTRTILSASAFSISQRNFFVVFGSMGFLVKLTLRFHHCWPPYLVLRFFNFLAPKDSGIALDL